MVNKTFPGMLSRPVGRKLTPAFGPASASAGAGSFCDKVTPPDVTVQPSFQPVPTGATETVALRLTASLLAYVSDPTSEYAAERVRLPARVDVYIGTDNDARSASTAVGKAMMIT